MSHSREAQLILKAIKANRFILRDHATRRADQRALSRQNVINVAKSLIEWKWQEDKQTNWFIGFLEANQSGGFTAAVDQGVWIITVFKRKATRRGKEIMK